MQQIKRIFRWVAASVGIVLMLAFLYVVAAVLLTLVPVNASYEAPKEGVIIYVQTNGVHTDFTLPVKHPVKDWSAQIEISHFAHIPLAFRYISFGWGDKGFYLQTPTWADLRPAVAVNALFWPSATAMHVTYDMAPPAALYSRQLTISENQYKALVNYIEASFRKDSQERIMLIKGFGYPGYYNNFYEAKGCYHLFYTSNNWTNEGLKRIGIKTATWAPFDWCVLYHLSGRN